MELGHATCRLSILAFHCGVRTVDRQWRVLVAEDNAVFRTKELHPEARPRIISDNEPQFIAKGLHGVHSDLGYDPRQHFARKDRTLAQIAQRSVHPAGNAALAARWASGGRLRRALQQRPPETCRWLHRAEGHDCVRSACSPDVNRKSTPSGIGSWKRHGNNGNLAARVFYWRTSGNWLIESDPALNHFVQQLRSDRLGNIIVHACFQAVLFVAVHHVGR